MGQIDPGIMLYCDHVVSYHYPYALFYDSHYQVLFLETEEVW